MENKIRYLRQTILSQIGDKGQEQLKNSTVAVVGCGGLASPALTYLAMAGVGNIFMIDADLVGSTDMNRQFIYEEKNIGEKKSSCAESYLRKRNSDIEIHSIHTFLNEENAQELLQGMQLVVDCVDNDKTRILISRTCQKLKIPVIEAGIYGFYGYVFPFLPGKSACIECLKSNITSEGHAIPAIGAVAGVIGSLQAMEGIKILLGIDVNYGVMVHYDGLQGEFTTIALAPREDCACRLSLRL